MIKHNSMSASNAKSAEPATTSDGCEAITNVIDSSNANETLSTIKTEIKHKNNTASLKTKLEYIAAPRLMGVCFLLLLLKIFTNTFKSVCDLLFCRFQVFVICCLGV